MIRNPLRHLSVDGGLQLLESPGFRPVLETCLGRQHDIGLLRSFNEVLLQQFLCFERGLVDVPASLIWIGTGAACPLPRS